MGFDQFLLTKLKENNPRFTAIDSPSKLLVEEDLMELATALRNNTHVKKLSLFCCGITDKAFAPLAEVLKDHPSIEALNLVDNDLTDRGAELVAQIIRQNKILQKLELRDNKNITASGASSLSDAVASTRSLKMFSFETLSIPAIELIQRHIEEFVANTEMLRAVILAVKEKTKVEIDVEELLREMEKTSFRSSSDESLDLSRRSSISAT